MLQAEYTVVLCPLSIGKVRSDLLQASSDERCSNCCRAQLSGLETEAPQVLSSVVMYVHRSICDQVASNVSTKGFAGLVATRGYQY